MTESFRPRLSSIVLYSKDVNTTLKFYSSLGIDFKQEKHGKGQIHYSAQLENGVLIEIYPGNKPPRIGFQVDSVDKIIPGIQAKDSEYGRFAVLNDPEGRVVELRETPSKPRE